MMRIKEISRLTGVSVRTLHHYDAIGLLKPTQITDAGYRLYDSQALERLCLILLFRELEFPLSRIRQILDDPDFSQTQALQQQIHLMQRKISHLHDCIQLAQALQQVGIDQIEPEELNMMNQKDYTAQAQALYGKTEAWQEYREKSKKRSMTQEQALGGQVMDLFTRLGTLRNLSPDSREVQSWVGELREFFNTHYYTCTPQILRSLGESYAAGGSMTENIGAAGGKGTGEFAREAIRIYCDSGEA